MLAGVLKLSAYPVSIEGDVIVKRIGDSYMFVFPAPRGRFILANTNPAGEIFIGKTVSVAYALKIIQGGKARFVSVDGSKIPHDVIDRLRIALAVRRAGKFFGFFVHDSRQPNLNISISPSFMKNAANKVSMGEQIARSGNLSVTLAPAGNGVKVLKVILD